MRIAPSPALAALPPAPLRCREGDLLVRTPLWAQAPPIGGGPLLPRWVGPAVRGRMLRPGGARAPSPTWRRRSGAASRGAGRGSRRWRCLGRGGRRPPLPRTPPPPPPPFPLSSEMSVCRGCREGRWIGSQRLRRWGPAWARRTCCGTWFGAAQRDAGAKVVPAVMSYFAGTSACGSRRCRC